MKPRHGIAMLCAGPSAAELQALWSAVVAAHAAVRQALQLTGFKQRVVAGGSLHQVRQGAG